MINAIGNAAMMDTVCKFAIELSLKMRTIGSRIRLRDQKVFKDAKKYLSKEI